MQQRKVKVVFSFFPYGGNGAAEKEHPDIRDWLIPTLGQIAKDDRIEPIDLTQWREGRTHRNIADCPIPMCRNEAVYWAKHEAKADVLVMIDSDNTPDVHLHNLPNQKPFFPSSFDFLYETFDHGPIMIGAPYCGPPFQANSGSGCSNVYVFKWTNADNLDPAVGIKLAQYSREEAYYMSGIAPVAALPTGCIMYDLRLFDHLPYPWFDYEYEQEGQRCEACGQTHPGPRRKKASTEDVQSTRNVSLILREKLGYEATYANWDAWAGHWKPQCVGRPIIATPEIVGRHFRQALKNPPSDHKRMYVTESPRQYIDTLPPVVNVPDGKRMHMTEPVAPPPQEPAFAGPGPLMPDNSAPRFSAADIEEYRSGKRLTIAEQLRRARMPTAHAVFGGNGATFEKPARRQTPRRKGKKRE